MLARRLFTRPATNITLRVFQIQRRCIHPSRLQLQAPLSPPNKAGSIHVAFGGILRFVERFVEIGSFILIAWVAYDSTKAMIEAKLLEKMIVIQQIDITYDSINFEDPLSTLSYFERICQPFTPHSVEEFNQLFEILMMQIINMGTKDDSTISAEFQAQHIIRSTAEKIHGVLRELNRDADVSTAKLVAPIVAEALESLGRLARDDPSPDWEIHSG